MNRFTAQPHHHEAGRCRYLRPLQICDNFDKRNIKLNGGVPVKFYEWLHDEFRAERYGLAEFLKLGRVNLNLGLISPAGLCHKGFGSDEIQYSACMSFALECQGNGVISCLEAAEYEYVVVLDGEKTVDTSLGLRFVEDGIVREFIFDPFLRQEGAAYSVLATTATVVPQLVADEEKETEDVADEEEGVDEDDDNTYVAEIECEDGTAVDILVIPEILKSTQLLRLSEGRGMAIGYCGSPTESTRLTLVQHPESEEQSLHKEPVPAPADLALLDADYEHDGEPVPPLPETVDLTFCVEDNVWQDGTLISTTILEFGIALELATFPDFLDCTSALTDAEFVQMLLADIGHKSRCALQLDKLPDEETMHEIAAKFGDLFALAVRNIMYHSEASPEYEDFLRSIGEHSSKLSSR